MEEIQAYDLMGAEAKEQSPDLVAVAVVSHYSSETFYSLVAVEGVLVKVVERMVGEELY